MRKLFKSIWDTFTDKEGEIELIRIIGTVTGLMFIYLFLKSEVFNNAISPDMLAAVLRVLEFIIVGVVGRGAITPLKNFVGDKINQNRSNKPEIKPVEPSSPSIEVDRVEGKNVGFKEAEKYIGVTEIKGGAHNPTIISWLKALKYDTAYLIVSDEVPWCATFANYILHSLGFKTTGSPAAKSFLSLGALYKIGDPLPSSDYVIVAVWHRGKSASAGHVEIVDAPSEKFRSIGGNVSDKVQMRTHNVNYPDFIEFRVITN